MDKETKEALMLSAVAWDKKMLDNIEEQLEADLNATEEPLDATEIEEQLTGGAKQLEGKVPMELLPWLPIMAIAQVLQFGAQKYDDWNWYKGLPVTTCVGSAFRHLAKFMMGEDTDDESGLPHLAHAGCNLLFALQFFLEGRPECETRIDMPAQMPLLPKPDFELWSKYAGFIKK